MLAALVRLPSVNPSLDATSGATSGATSDATSGATSGATSPGEGALAAFVAGFLCDAGFQVRQEQVLPGRPNVVATLGQPSATRPALLLECHLDTVPLGGMGDGFAPTVRGGALYGRGACDVKGGLAAMMLALARHARAERPLVFWGAIDEEHDFTGVRALAERGLAAVGAVVAEPTGLVPVVAHPGNLRLEVVTHGRAAHTARPELGDNAILHAARLVGPLQEGFAARFAGVRHPLSGPARWSVTQIATDNPVNVIPDRCRLGVDVRLPPGLDGQGVLDWLERALADAGAPAEARPLRPADPALDTDPGAAVARWALEAAGAVLRQPVAPAGAPYSTDASKIVALAGVPAIVLGPGDIAFAHTVREHIALAEVAAAVEVYSGIIERFLRA